MTHATIQVGELAIQVTQKAVKNVHLSVHPPDGRVTLVTPSATRLEVARAYAVSKLGWIRRQQQTLAEQARETPRRFIRRESHYVWGRRYLLNVVEREARPSVTLDHRRITLSVRPGSDQERRQRTMHRWHKSSAPRRDPAVVREMVCQARRHRRRVLPATDENPLGKLQPRGQTRPVQHRTGQKAEGPPGVRGRPRIRFTLLNRLTASGSSPSCKRIIRIGGKHGLELNELPLGAEGTWGARDGL